jgi:serine/threonine protein kinase
MAAAAQPAESDLVIGTLVAGRYTVIKKIGRGGEGDVFLVEEENQARQGALKITRTASERTAARALRTADLLRRIEHPHIVRVIDAGRLADGRAYILSEWIDGPSLHEYFKKRFASAHELCTIGELIADALAAVHAVAGVHRDIKPANILLRCENRAPALTSLVVVDFGLLQECRDRGAQGGLGTRFGSIGGTYKFMAPEQLAGRRNVPQTDFYGLGATLYDLLYRPAEGPDDWGRASLEQFEIPWVRVGAMVKRRLTEETTVPISDHVPESLRALIAQLLRRIPEERGTSALALASQFREIRYGLSATDPCE